MRFQRSESHRRRSRGYNSIQHRHQKTRQEKLQNTTIKLTVLSAVHSPTLESCHQFLQRFFETTHRQVRQQSPIGAVPCPWGAVASPLWMAVTFKGGRFRLPSGG